MSKAQFAQLKIKVIPRARQTTWGGRRGDALVVRLTSAPIRGAANRDLLRFLQDQLGLARGDLEIASGERSRSKIVRVYGLTQPQLDALISQLSGQ